ncbi:hypothetical protein [Leptodesmis sp.]|uniref:hypothetical protein n=1 Tax=Leptodesmis sp. TaxID=3100501 RepID=UPI0040535AE2
MPDDPHFAIALDSTKGAFYCLFDGVELVVAGDDFTDTGASIGKDGEVLDQL